MVETNITLFPKLVKCIEKLEADAIHIPESRKKLLQPIADFVYIQLSKGRKAELVFICTHNSRRSHFGQIWGQTMAAYYGLEGVITYSGGTEATAFNPNAIKALRSEGFSIKAMTRKDNNPQYRVFYSEGGDFTRAWSKVYTDTANPQQGFCAIMTCDEANEACPIVFGASQRVAVTYKDPKISDGTPKQDKVYRERCRQIGTEMAFIFSQVKKAFNYQETFS